MQHKQDFEVSVSPDGTYVEVKIYAPMDSEVGYRCGVAATALAKRYRIKRFLFDSRLSSNVQSVTVNYEFAYEGLDAFGFPRDSRSALLVAPDDDSHDFLETLFKNAGYSVRLFHDEAQAVAWLEGGKPNFPA
jgi:hypothetical protein